MKISTAIEICEKHIKLAQVSSKGAENTITACVFKQISVQEPEDVASELRGVLKENNIKAKDVILVVPRQAVTAKNIRLPSQNLTEISEMAGFQAAKQIPYPKEEIIYGFNVTGIDDEGYSKVLLVICHRDMVERPIRILNKCGLKPAKVTLSSFGLLNWLNSNADLEKKSSDAPLILADCDFDSSDIAVVYKGKLVYTRGLTFGSGYGCSDGRNFYDKLTEEILRTIPAFEKELPEKRPTEALFTGNISELASRATELEKALGMKVEFIETFRDLGLNIPAGYKDAVESGSYSSLIGAVLGAQEVDLLPKVLKAASTAYAKKKKLMVTATLSIAVLLTISFVIFNKVFQKEQVLRSLESKLQKISPAAKEVERLRSVSEIVRSQSNKRSEALTILNELHRIIPPQIYLALYKYENGKVELKGSADVLSDIFRLVTILEKSPYFQNVEVKYATKRKVGEQELVDFTITCPISPGAGEKR